MGIGYDRSLWKDGYRSIWVEGAGEPHHASLPINIGLVDSVLKDERQQPVEILVVGTAI
jgi:hypothetical protein